jgi:hypothetical protein
MKRSLLTIIAWCTLNGFVSASPSLTTEVSRIDGLPARLLAATDLHRDLLGGDKSIDLIPALKAMGCNIEDGETALYHAPSGSLLRNLSEENHRVLKEIIDNLYRTDNLLVTYRAYMDLLEPLSSEERLKVVKRVGFLPDPLVSSIVATTRAAENNEARLESDRKILALLNIALDRMKHQIAVMENSKAEQSAPSGGAKHSN